MENPKEEKKGSFLGSMFKVFSKSPSDKSKTTTSEKTSETQEEFGKVKTTTVTTTTVDEKGDKKTTTLTKKQITLEKANSNIAALSFAPLADVDAVPVFQMEEMINCMECKNAFSAISHVVKQEKDKNVTWKCEYCGHENKIPRKLSKKIRKTKSSAIDYCVFSPETNPDTSASPKSVKTVVDDDSLVIFCIDISGSMSTTSSLPTGHELVKIKGVSGSSISRIQCIQAAIDIQLEEIYKSTPSKKVILVTFSEGVTVIAEAATTLTVVIPTDKQEDFGKLVEEGVKVTLSDTKCVRDAKESLSQKIFALKADGSTALGPAISVAVGIASQKQGSEIILCTDGLPNKGIGGKDAGRSQFYETVGSFAKNSGTTISIVGIEGTNCDVKTLSILAEKSSGSVNIVKPVELQRQMRMLIDNPTICTDVEVTSALVTGLSFKGQPQEVSKTGNKYQRTLGSITAETEMTLEFGVSKKGNFKSFQGVDHVPLQVQIKFTKKNRSKWIRVISVEMQLTEDRKVAEENCDVSILGMHALQTVAKLATVNNAVARNKLLSSQKLLQRICKTDTHFEEYANFISQCEDLETTLLNLSKSSSMDDNSSKVLQRTKGLGRVAFLAGSRKQEIVSKRKKHVEKQETVSTNTSVDSKDAKQEVK